ncbi:MAG: nucleotidyltransferase domain-containing protein [Muribaculaceae bacterium]|nr:nucleotidyltransferase domain-containing protein [Muribaculaceae bacterium]
MSNKSIIKELKRISASLFTNSSGSAYLYGSRARGEAVSDSDWDILVILDDTLKGDNIYEKYVFPFAEVGWRNNAEVVPIHFTASQWEAQSCTQFYRNVIKDMIRL